MAEGRHQKSDFHQYIKFASRAQPISIRWCTKDGGQRGNHASLKACREQKQSADSNQRKSWPNGPNPEAFFRVYRLERVRWLIGRKSSSSAQPMSPQRLIGHVHDTHENQQRAE
jgi:hypothetical protein